MAGTVGARGVVQKHPLIETIQQAGSAFKDMGNLFTQTRQARTYEKSVQNQHWQNVVGLTLDAYDKFAEATDAGHAYNAFSGTLSELLVAGGVDPGVARGLLQRVTDENLNPRYFLGRVYKEALTEEGGLDTSKAIGILDEEVKRKREDIAIEQAALGGEEPEEGAAPTKAPSAVTPGVQAGKEPALPELPPEERPTEWIAPVGPGPGAKPVPSQPSLAPTQQAGPGRFSNITEANVKELARDYRSAPPEQKLQRLQAWFPEFATITPRVRATFEMLIRGIEQKSPALQLKAVKTWAQEMYKEATP